MNPQYLSQQYGAPPHGFPNINQNNQGFQSVPLAPPKSGISTNMQPSSVSSLNQGPQLSNLLGKMPSGNLGPFSLLPPDQNTSQDSLGQKHNSNNNGAPQEPLLDLAPNDNNAPPRSLQPHLQNGPPQNGSGEFNIPASQLPPSSIHSRPSGPPLHQLPHGMPPMPLNRSSPNSQIPTRTSPSFTPSSQAGQIGPPPTTQSVPALSGNEPASGQMAPSIGGQFLPPQNRMTSPMGSQLNPNQFGEQTRTLSQQNSVPRDIQQNPLGPPPQGIKQTPLGPPPLALQNNLISAQNATQNSSGAQGVQHNPLGPPMPGFQHNPLMPHTQNNQQNSSDQQNNSAPSQGAQQNPLGSAPPVGQSHQQGQTQFSGQSKIPPMGQPQQFGSGSFPPSMIGQNVAARSPQQSGALPPQKMPSSNLLGSQNQPVLPGQFPLPGQPPVSNQSTYSQQPLRGPHQMTDQSMMHQNQYGQPPLPPGQPQKFNLPGQPPLPGQAPFAAQPPNSAPTPSQFFPPPPKQVGGPGQIQPNSNFNKNRIPPSQYSNQISDQMQNMNLGAPKQFSEVSQKGPINGEMPPHMLPPLNGQQMRGSGGFPLMPGQTQHMPPMPGQPQQMPPMPGQLQQMPPMSGQPQHMPPMPGQPQQMPPAPGGYPPQPGYPSQQRHQQQPGYPPQPGHPQQPGYPQHLSYEQQQAQRRLDPDQMPSPIQVMTDDQTNRSGVFITNQRGLMPPLVTTNFVVQDQGNTSPRFIRSTMYNVPVSNDIMKSTAVPFSLVISPMARLAEGEYPPPIVNFGELGPVRCIRCKAYMCPFMNFVDSGRRFQCAFCKATTDVPAEYFQHLDHTGQRMDRFERPELVLGTYEFVATADYCRNNILPKPPAIIFVVDVSYNSVKSGLIHLLCSQMKEIIKNLPVDQGMEKSNMRVGFITYNSSVHFYNIKGTLAAPQMLVVGDTQEMFMPLLDGFLSTPDESEVIIDALMEQIPTMFAGTRETETVLLPAILAGMEALKASECVGKLLVFTSNLPSAEAPGKLKNRDDRKLLGTDKERTILTPQNQAYNQLGQDCVQVGCSVDLFVFNNSYIDVATIGQVSRLSGGEVYKYTYFQADIDGERLIGDIILDISRPIAFDAIMRVRTSTGVRPTDFYGHFFMSNTTDMELASIDCDKAIALEIKHDDKLQEEDGVFIQSALLYTSCSGQRRLRISNLSLKTCSQMADLYRTCDLDTLINYICKQSIFKLMDNNPKAVKDAIVNRAAHILATYRKHCASPSSAGQLILPECMKLLPLYTNCLLKSDALSGGSDMTVDDRSYVMQAVMTMDVPSSVHFFYPRLVPIHDIKPEKEVAVPYPIRCTIEKMTEQGVYILENGIHMFLWIGLGASPDFIQNVFGVPSAVQVNIEQTRLPELDNPLSIAVRNIIEEIRIQRHRHMRLTMVRQREKLESVYKHFLVEDRGVDGSPSYVDFLCHMHKEIRSILS